MSRQRGPWETWDDLPVWERKEDFFKVFDNSDICFVHAATGSGKSTLVPVLICIHADDRPSVPKLWLSRVFGFNVRMKKSFDFPRC